VVLLLIKTQDKKSVVNVDNVNDIQIVTADISRNYAAAIIAYFNNGAEVVLGKYNDINEANETFESFCKACGNKTFIFDF
jgi:hypothetical protein